MTYVSSSGDMATISWMLRPEWPGTGRGAGARDSGGSLGSEAGGWVAGSPRLFTDSSAELRGDSGAGLQLAEVFGVLSVDSGGGWGGVNEA